MEMQVRQLVGIGTIINFFGIEHLLHSAGHTDHVGHESITFIVNRGAGGSTDLVARAVANSIQHDKGITTAVVNYEGGDGLIGVAELMNSAP